MNRFCDFFDIALHAEIICCAVKTKKTVERSLALRVKINFVRVFCCSAFASFYFFEVALCRNLSVI